MKNNVSAEWEIEPLFDGIGNDVDLEFLKLDFQGPKAPATREKYLVVAEILQPNPGQGKALSSVLERWIVDPLKAVGATIHSETFCFLATRYNLAIPVTASEWKLLIDFAVDQKETLVYDQWEQDLGSDNWGANAAIQAYREEEGDIILAQFALEDGCYHLSFGSTSVYWFESDGVHRLVRFRRASETVPGEYFDQRVEVVGYNPHSDAAARLAAARAVAFKR
jgi:hypothetical protein